MERKWRRISLWPWSRERFLIQNRKNTDHNRKYWCIWLIEMNSFYQIKNITHNVEAETVGNFFIVFSSSQEHHSNVSTNICCVFEVRKCVGLHQLLLVELVENIMLYNIMLSSMGLALKEARIEVMFLLLTSCESLSSSLWFSNCEWKAYTTYCNVQIFSILSIYTSI